MKSKNDIETYDMKILEQLLTIMMMQQGLSCIIYIFKKL